MSWSLTVPNTAKDEWNAAVDAAQASGQDASTPGLEQDVAAAKEALKLLGSRVKRDVVRGVAGGHCLGPREGDGIADRIHVEVAGSWSPRFHEPESPAKS